MDDILEISSDKCLCFGVEHEGGIKILIGSRARKKMASSYKDHHRQEQRNIINNGYVEVLDDQLLFVKEYHFTSKALAESVLKGQSRDGSKWAVNKKSIYLSYIRPNFIDSRKDINEAKSPPIALLNDIEKIYANADADTERQSQVLTRIGQGQFREKLINYWGTCAITGCNIVSILRASHIKPWRSATDYERLDLYNGLLLSPNADALFDLGLISLDTNGEILQSNILGHSNLDLSPLGISSTCKVRIEEQHKRYLEFHRNNIFRRVTGAGGLGMPRNKSS